MGVLSEMLIQFIANIRNGPPMTGIHGVAQAFVRALVRRARKIGFDPTVTYYVRGVRLYIPISHNLPLLIAGHNLYDSALPAIVAFMQARKGSEFVMIDVGANIGDTAVFCASAVGAPNIYFVCIEADPRYLTLFQKNTSHLNVTLHHAIAGREIKKVSVNFSGTNGTGSIINGSTETNQIKLDAIDDAWKADIIKTDTDGYELEVLMGASNILEKNSTPIFLEYSPMHLRKFGAISPLDLIQFLISKGYFHAAVWDHAGYPLGLFDLRLNQYLDLARYCDQKPLFYIDMLVMKDGIELASVWAAMVPVNKNINK